MGDSKMTRPQFVRERVDPIMKQAGYRKSGQTYRYLVDGYQAVFQVRGPRTSFRPIELEVGQGLLVAEWLDFKKHYVHSPGHPYPSGPAFPPFEKAQASAGPISTTMNPPQGDHGRGQWWGFHPSETDWIELFAHKLRADAAKFAALTDPLAFEREVRAGCPIEGLTPRPRPELLTVVLSGQGRFDEARQSLAETTGTNWHDKLTRWVERKMNESAV